MKEDFILLNKMILTNEYIDKVLDNFPKKETVLYNEIKECMYHLIRYIYSFNLQRNNRIRNKYINDLLTELAMMNYYIKVAYHKKYASRRQCIVIGNYLDEIKKMSYGVVKSEI